MLKILIRSRLRDKKGLVISLLSIILASVLMFTVSFVFSSVHHYLIKITDKGYTVIIEGKLDGYDNYLKRGDYYFDFRSQDVYEKVESICKRGDCAKITYNKKRGVFNLEEEDKAKPYPFIDKIKKILSIKLLYLFDEAKIQKELNLEKDYYRICDITKLLLLLSLLILIVRPYITLLIFFGIVLLNWISFLVIRKKCIG